MSDIQRFHRVFLELAIDVASRSLEDDGLTPFGAVVARGDKLISVGISSVMQDRNPVAHAEVNAIIEACKNQGSHLLHDCVLYCSGFPCPLCLSAARWAEMSGIFYGATLEDSDRYGFRDLEFYKDLKMQNWGKDSVFPVAGGPYELQRSAADIIRRWNRDRHG